MKTEQARRIGIVAADPLRLIGLEAILSGIDGLCCVALTLEGIFADCDLSALVLDGRVAGNALAELLLRLRRELPGVKTIVLGETLDPQFIQTVIGAGAKGYLAETANEAEVRMALDVVLDGSVWAPRKVLARLIEAGTAATAPAGWGEPVASRMTPRETEVLKLLMDGGSNRDIAVAMGIDETTVKAHLGRMLRKAGAANRVELTLRAMEERD
jgi:DNA-binding NarL/FixJ family response regulator